MEKKNNTKSHSKTRLLVQSLCEHLVRTGNGLELPPENPALPERVTPTGDLGENYVMIKKD